MLPRRSATASRRRSAAPCGVRNTGRSGSSLLRSATRRSNRWPPVLCSTSKGAAMQSFPHRYGVTAIGDATHEIELTAPSLPAIVSAAPAEFDGPGTRWSPETLLVAAVGDCFVLTFRAIARASRVSWTSLRCDVAGTLARVDNVTQFTAFDIRARIVVP